MAKNNSKNGKATRVAKVIAGARKNFPNGAETLTLDGASTTIDAVLTSSRRSSMSAPPSSLLRRLPGTRWRPSVQDCPRSRAFRSVRGLRPQRARSDLRGPGRLRDPGPQGPGSEDRRAEGSGRRQAQGDARSAGTKGPVARKAVKGNITAQLVVTPAVSDAAGAPTAPATAPTAAAPGGTPATPPRA